MTKINKILLLLLSLIFVISCSDDDEPLVLGEFQDGFFITNEGPFQNGSGTLTFVKSDGEVTNNAYKGVNNEDLGNIVQSMALYDDKAYIIVNNSHKIVVANRFTMEKITTIEGDDIENPRYFVAVGNKAFVSNWGDSFDNSDDFIAVIDLNSNTVTTKIMVGEGPEEMLVSGNKLYVNLQGGFGQNNKVLVIDPSTNTIDTKVEVGDVPNSIIQQSNGNVWVICGGKPSFTGDETSGKLVEIVNNSVSRTLDFQTTEHPSHLSIDGTDLYYNLNGKVYGIDITATELEPLEKSSFNGFYYNMTINNGKLYATDASDFASEGSLKVFNLTDESLENTITAGIIPGSVVFQ